MKDVYAPLTLRNEVAALRHLQAIVETLLAAYPRSLDEDREMLAGPSLAPFSNERHATIQVRGEKEVLHHYRLLTEVALDLLENVECDDDAAFVTKSIEYRRRGVHTDIMRYCSNSNRNSGASHAGLQGVVGFCRFQQREKLGKSEQF